MRNDEVDALEFFLPRWNRHSQNFELQEDVLVEKVRLELEGEWRWRTVLPWIYVEPEEAIVVPQGWKLHISATCTSALNALKALLPIFSRERCPFKFIANLRLVELTNSAHWPREAAGKFITIYPNDGESARYLADICHQATEGMAGPRILSDRPYKSGSLVHYRYGSFTQRQKLGLDGSYVNVMQNSLGEFVPDDRKAWFTPPNWTRDPFLHGGKHKFKGRDHYSEAEAIGSNNALLLAKRYRVVQVIRHANKGGVYKAIDLSSDQPVLVKEARPHTCTDRYGRDAIFRLKRETSILTRLKNCAVVPRVLDHFSYGGHYFLIEEYLKGAILREYAHKHFDSKRIGLPRQKLMKLMRCLAESLRRCHEEGVIFRDFNPNNIFVMADEEIRIIDPELAFIMNEQEPPVRGATVGYSSPQQLSNITPTVFDDYYSLGATFYYLLTYRDPLLIREERRKTSTKFEELLDLLVDEGLVLAELAHAILACLDEQPEQRWGPIQWLSLLDELEAQENFQSITMRPLGNKYIDTIDFSRIPEEIANHLLGTMRLEGSSHLWPTTSFGASTDPCNLQHGASGVGSFLLGVIGAENTCQRKRVGQLVDWVIERVSPYESRLPGLYLGTSGMAWFLLDAALVLKDERILETARRLALSVLPISVFHDITHGTAGIGLTQLRFWLRTRERTFLNRAKEAADHLLEVAIPHSNDSGLVWPVPNQIDSAMRGLTYYGFAHGNAGISYFLLAIYAATGETDYLKASIEGVATLTSEAQLIDGCAYWSFGPTQPAKWVHWCNGSSGIGTTLIRMYHVTKNEKYRVLSEMAAEAVVSSRWRSSLVQCHGLAGDGEFLLDMYDYLGDSVYLKAAHGLANIIYAHRVDSEGITLFPDESGSRLSSEWGMGYAGVASFLHRLLSKTQRKFMVDEIFGDHCVRGDG